MSHHIIDRRKNQKGKSTGNRRRFLRRVRNQVKEAAKRAIREGDIKSITSTKGRKISVPAKDLKEHEIRHGQGGDSERVFPGNKEFITGDRIRRPGGGGAGQGQGKNASDSGKGEDSFTFELSKDEFLDLFFEDLELPDMYKKNLKVAETFQYNRAGFVTDGTPSRMNIVRSMRQAKGRRQALRGPMKKKLKDLENELELLNQAISSAEANGADCSIEKERRTQVLQEIEKLKRRIRAVPFVDEMDLRFNHWVKTPHPTTRAVMFCIMDVSGSMGEWEKEMAKRFFMLLYLFLTKAYEKVDLVFIRHHTEAKEVDEEEFFHSRETGGTLVSPALEEMIRIIQERYDLQSWNIYACQASDGDNWPHDTQNAKDILQNQILQMVQYYAYVEIDRYQGKDSDLWGTYEEIRASHKNFDMTVINDAKDIYPVFRRLFEKEKGSAVK